MKGFLKLVEKIKTEGDNEDLKEKIEEMSDEELEEFYQQVKNYYHKNKGFKELESNLKQKINTNSD